MNDFILHLAPKINKNILHFAPKKNKSKHKQKMHEKVFLVTLDVMVHLTPVIFSVLG